MVMQSFIVPTALSIVMYHRLYRNLHLLTYYLTKQQTLIYSISYYCCYFAAASYTTAQLTLFSAATNYHFVYLS